jgi:hypothetical protein
MLDYDTSDGRYMATQSTAIGMKYFAILLLFVLALPWAALADCNCENEVVRYPQVKFTGKVSSLTPRPDWASNGVTLDVESFENIVGLKDEAQFKEIKERSQVVVDSFAHQSDCSVKFELGMRYYVVADLINLGNINLANGNTPKIMERWFTIHCYGTRKISD